MRIVLIEDDERLADQLVPTLEAAGLACRWAADGASGLRAIEEDDPDLVLLDLMLPDRTGFEVLATLRTRSTVPVIVLTARALGEDKVEALDLGADDYVTKPFWDRELLARVRAVGRRRTAVREDAVVSFGKVRIDLAAREITVGGEPIRLTPTEFNLLAFLVKREGQALPTERIVDMVLLHEEATATALQAHVSRLRKKLGEDGERLRTVWGIGYRFDGR